MKINRLEAHDRLLYFQKDQVDPVVQGLDDCLKRNPNSISMQEYFPYIYIFGHPRTDDTSANKRLIWQPRLGKPKAQTNSYLFRALSKTDLVEIVWIIPPREMWPQYEPGKVTASVDVMTSIKNFLHHRKHLEQPHKDDWSEDRIQAMLRKIQDEQNKKKKTISS